MRIFLVLLFFYTALFGIQKSSQNQLEKVTLQLHWKYQFEFAGFIMAKEKGFYRDVGLDVELKEYQNGMDISDEVISGRANYGIYNSQLLIEYLQGKPIKLLASFFKRAALVLVTQPDIKTPKDLVGKKVMTTTKEDFILNFKPFLEKYGVKIKDLELVPHTYTIDTFVEKKVDALSAFTSDQPLKLKEKNIAFNILDPSDDNLFIMQMELFTTQNEFKTHKNRTTNFIKASIRGWEYALKHKDEAIQILLDKYNRGLTKQELIDEAKAIEKLILPFTYEIGSVDTSFLKKQAKLFKKNYCITSQRSIKEYIYDPYSEENTEFTYEELVYIKQHPHVKICPHYDLFPLDGVDNNKHVGIMADIFALISKNTGLTFDVVPSKNFQDMKTKVIEKKCEIVPIVPPDLAHDLGGILYTTDVLIKGHFTIITAIDKPFIKLPKLLKNKKLLVTDPYVMQFLKKLYPNFNFEFVADKKEMVQQVLDDKAFGFVVIDEQADYIIDMLGYGKLKLGGFLAKTHPIEGAIGILEDKPLLVSIIKKAVASIPKTTIQKIKESWHMTRYHKQTDYKVVLEVLFIALLIVFILVYYQKKLKKLNSQLEYKVDEKTKELITLNEQLEALVKEKVQEIVQKDKILAIQSKQAIMGEMITMIAHQWRQPLNTITLQISNLQIKRMMGEKVDAEEYDKVLSEITKTITYLSETIDDFQTFFHPDRELTKASLKDVIQKAVNFVKPRIKNKNITIDLHVDDDLVVNLYVNEIIQVILNILNNAIDALLECQKDTKKITIETKSDDTRVHIYIHDNACGIDEAIIKRLFEPYFSTKGKNGTGLGLYMSAMIMQKQFSGDITVETKKGVGSTFIITFPKF
jgi:signal transduction histidine kinase/ABC-type nitrate/sulfonate/bicarbonate transport system substrate-binding protein